MRLALITIAALCLGTVSAAAQEADVSEGEARFRVCTACHSVGEDAANRLGPVLNGVFGRRAGTYAGFSYSAAMMTAGKEGLIWTPKTLSQYLAAPKKLVPGNKMAFIGLKDEIDRVNVIAYLQTFSPEYSPTAE